MSDPEIEDLRDKVHCAVVLERTPPPWKLDRKESTKLSLKYRRGKGEILIVSHGGKGWWDPTSDAKGDVFSLVQRLEPGINFGHVRKRLREFAGLSPRPGAISCGSAFFHRRSSRRPPRSASCGKAQPAAPGSLISTARDPSPMSTFAGRRTKVRSAAAPSPSSACPHRLNPSRGSFSPRPRLTL